MTTRPHEHPISEAYGDPGRAGAAWDLGIAELERSETYWMATVHPSGRPHVVPVPWPSSTTAACTSLPARTQKARNLTGNPSVTVTTHGEGLDVVLDGRARRVTDREVLPAVADAYATRYGWEPTVHDAALHAEGAPTAGPPPYHVHAIVPDRVFGFPTDSDAPPTRWRFPAST